MFKPSSRVPEHIFFFALVSILTVQVISNFNLFNYALAVRLPLLLTPLVIYILLKKFRFNSDLHKLHKGHLLYFLIISFITVTPLLNLLVHENMVDNSGIYSSNYLFVISSLIGFWLLTGGMLAYFHNFTKTTKALIIFSFCIGLYFIGKGTNGSYFVDYYYLRSIRMDSIPINHLGLTEPLTYIFFLLISISFNNKLLKWLVILTVTLMLFSLGGRLAFFCFIATILIYEYFRMNLINYTFTIFISIITVTMLFILFSEKLISSSAYQKLLFSDGLEEDSSFQARLGFFQSARSNFLDQFLIGNANNIIEDHGYITAYAHNIISVFQFYGLIPFLIILTTYYYIFKVFIKDRLYKLNSNVEIFSCLLLIYSFFSVLIGKALVFTPIWTAIGFWLLRIPLLKTSLRAKSLT